MTCRKFFTTISIATFSVCMMDDAAFASFSDVSSNNYFSDAINYVQEQGIVSGYADGTYRPNNQINRAEFTKIVMLSKFGQQMIDRCGSSMHLSDVSFNDWFGKYVCRGKDTGIISGYADGTFRPNASINFSEAAKIIARTDTFNAGDPVLPPDTGGPWYQHYVQYLGNNRAIPDSITSFDHLLTRGEMAEMIYDLKTGDTGNNSQTYDLIKYQDDLLHDPAALSQEKIYNYNGITLSFRLPADWPHEQETGANASDGSLWTLHLGPLDRASNAYLFTLKAYDHDPSRASGILADSTNENRRDTMKGNARIIAYTHGPMCNTSEAFIITGKVDYQLTGGCAADDPTFNAQFESILRSLSATDSSTTTAPVTSTRTYTDPGQQYSITYPSSWAVNTDSDGSVKLDRWSAHTGEDIHFINQAYIHVSVPERCPAEGSSPGSVVQTVQLGGHAFTAYEQNEGAAGTLYYQIVFTSPIDASHCIVLQKLIGVSDALQENQQDAQVANQQLVRMQDELKDVIKTIQIY